MPNVGSEPLSGNVQSLVVQVQELVKRLAKEGGYSDVHTFATEGIAGNGGRGIALMFVVQDNDTNAEQALFSLLNAFKTIAFVMTPEYDGASDGPRPN